MSVALSVTGIGAFASSLPLAAVLLTVGASLLPRTSMVSVCAVPSVVKTRKVWTRSSPSANACTAGAALFST